MLLNGMYGSKCTNNYIVGVGIRPHWVGMNGAIQIFIDQKQLKHTIMASEVTPSETMPTGQELKGELNANVFQIAKLNNMLPRGYRLELYDTVRKNEPSEFKSGKRKKVVSPQFSQNMQATKRSEIVTGQEYEKAFQESDVAYREAGSRKAAQKAASKRYSSREKKPVSIEDLGYVDKEQARRGGKGTFATSEGYKKCERLLAQLRKHPYATHFMTAPVHIPGYTEIIKEPMDLNTVEKKLKSGAYPSSYHFALDIRKIWNNSWTYNPQGTEVFNYTNEISNYFEKLMKEVGDVQFVPEENLEIQDLKKKVDKVAGVLKRFTATGAGPATTKAGGTPKTALDRPMTAQEKAQLRQKIMMLPQEKLHGVISIIQDSIDMSKSNEVLEFDIDSLPTRKCRELEQYVSRALGGATTKPVKKKAEPKPKAGKARPQVPPPAPQPKPEVRYQENYSKQEKIPPLGRAVTVSDVQPSPASHVPMIGMNLQAQAQPMQTEARRAPEEKKQPIESSEEESDESRSGMLETCQINFRGI
eukprot:TRINITY_DN916_c0_g1_i1.p2 TRINITY_DN916_c0_g1~~TRINITY_DN916_c0_g1_i1.p2  ORF type:complete len:530 (-),score=67.04 TRINITY_DN916_c0_g1_i1:10370-11959(-)